MLKEIDFKSATNNSWKLVDANHPIGLYVGKDENGFYAMEYVGDFILNKKIKSSSVISINHYKTPNGEKSIVFSLIDERWMNQFVTFCNDVCKQTEHLQKNSSKGYEAVCNAYFVWQKMFKGQNDILGESEIKGLIGELLYLKEIIIPKYGQTRSIEAWSGTEKTRKDFSIDNTWYEIKTIDVGKPTVKITSIEQLDSSLDGTLAVFQVEKMAPGFNGVNLNCLTESIITLFTSLQDKDDFISKLNKAGYFSNSDYDDYVYDIKSLTEYNVNNSFPRLMKNSIPVAVASASYELLLSELDSYKK
jgi:hypothetical protein